MSDDLKPGVWYRAGATVYRLREVEGKGRLNWSAPGVRALENEVLCRVEGAAAEVAAERIHAFLAGTFLDVKPNLGAGTPEPSLREIVHRYYAPHFASEEAARLTEQYCAIIQIWAGLAQPAPGGPDAHGWLPIGDKLKDAGGYSHLPDGEEYGLGWYTDVDDRLLFLLWWKDLGNGRSEVTHWRPLLAGPASLTPEA